MARTQITPQAIARTGVTQSPTVGTVDGHKFENDGRVWALVDNLDGVNPRVITFQTPAQVNGLNVAELQVTLAAGATDVHIGPFPKDTFNIPSGQTDAGQVYVDYEAGQETQFQLRLFKIDRADLVL